jgi:hypothetical protein
MTEPVSLAAIRTHLRLDESGTDEDAALQAMLIAARRRCEQEIRKKAADLPPDDLTMLVHAIKLIVGGWYRNRESSAAAGALTELPHGVYWLLWSLKSMALD